MPVRLSIVVPCYNEEEVISATYERLVRVADGWEGVETQMIFVDDGSADSTWALLSAFAERDPRVCAVKLSRNFGHQKALTAGLDHARGDAVAIIDADLQDPPELIPQMLDLWRQGADVVHGVRASRKESVFHRFAYALFYRIMRFCAEMPIPLDSGDFCLLDRRVVALMKTFPERNRFHRGLRAWVGFRQVEFFYERHARAAGTPKYTLRRLVALAAEGIFNFSSVPLQFMAYVGLFVSLSSFTMMILLFLWRLSEVRILGAAPGDVGGFTTIILLIVFFSGLQLMGFGILGAYVSRLYAEVKQRPHYVVEASVPRSDDRLEAGYVACRAVRE